MLEVANLAIAYGDAPAVWDASLQVTDGQIVAVIGPNGAGKTTLLRAVTGLLGVHRGRISAGTVTLAGERIDHLPAAAIVRRGVAQVMEGEHGVFTALQRGSIVIDTTVATSAHARGDAATRSCSHARADAGAVGSRLPSTRSSSVVPAEGRVVTVTPTHTIVSV